MQNNLCIAIKQNGDQCTRKPKNGHERCGMHLKSLERNGPHATQRNELKFIHKKKLGESFDKGVHVDEYDLIVAANDLEMAELVNKQNEEIRRTGVDPDQNARAIREEQREQRLAQRAELNRLNRRAIDQMVHHNNDVVENARIEMFEVNTNLELQQFSNDRQNVHTKAAVDLTMSIIEKIRKIPVSDEYKWNKKTCSKTPGEIIVECQLSMKAASQMMTYYTDSNRIYELEKGIYGKVLDSVWQFIKTSDDTSNLCKILKQELEDNVGMCAMGNLTRICNVLSGYFEGLVIDNESPNEKLGNLLYRLMTDVIDESEKIKKAEEILKDMKVPQNEWSVWIEPLKA